MNLEYIVGALLWYCMFILIDILQSFLFSYFATNLHIVLFGYVTPTNKKQLETDSPSTVIG